MKINALLPFAAAVFSLIASGMQHANQNAARSRMDLKKDLLLLQYDCKTDVDDLHSVAAFITLISGPLYTKVGYHAVAGTYGIQEGLYVPGDELFRKAFGDHWTDAHHDKSLAVEQVAGIVQVVLSGKGDVWIAEAGQSDFTALLVKQIQKMVPGINTRKRIHVVQHSNWNEEVTSPGSLGFVRENTDYRKIPDGNVVGNGTPGFRSPDFSGWANRMKDRRLAEVWQMAVDIANSYNGIDGRYNNGAVTAGGLDFSDLAEVCWILGLEDDIRDSAHFFDLFAK